MPTGIYERTKEHRKNTSLAQTGKKRKPLSKKTKLKISEKHKGKKLSEEHKLKLSKSHKGKTPWNKGKIGCLSEEHKQKMILAWKGHKHSEETKKKISESNTGRKHSEETKRKIGEGNRRKKVKPTSEETRKKLSEIMKKKCAEGTHIFLKLAGKRLNHGKPRLNDNQYLTIKRNGKYILEHHRVWLNESEWHFIPRGFCIHHRNGNKLDNRIENLACIPKEVHTSLHMWLKKQGKEQNVLRNTSNQ